MSFKSVARKVARKEHEPIKEADREIAYSSRNASAAAKKKNPNLKKVKGKGKK